MHNEITREGFGGYMPIISASTPASIASTDGYSQIDARSVGHRFALGATWNLIGAVLARALGLFASIVAARILGKESYGALGIVQSTLGLFGLFAGFGLGVTATKHVAEFRNTDPARTSRIIRLCALTAAITSIFMAVVSLAAIPWLASHTLGSPQLIPALRAGVALILLGGINGAQSGILLGFEAFKQIARINIITGIVNVVFTFLLAPNWGLYGAVWALNAGLLVNMILNHHAIKLNVRLYGIDRPRGNLFQESGIVFRFSLPALLGSIMVGPANWICNALLVNRPGGLGDMGLINAALQWRIALLFIPGTIGDVVLPLMTSSLSAGDHRSYIKLLRYSLLVNMLVGFIIASFLIIIRSWLLRSYGSSFENGNAIFVIIIISGIIIAINNGLSRSIVSSGKIWIDLAWQSVWGIIFVSTGRLFIPHIGVMGYGYAALIAAVVQGVCQSISVFRTIKTMSSRKVYS